LAVSFSPFRNWRIDLSGAYSLGTVQVKGAASQSERSLSLDGPTDAKIRTIGRLLSDRLWLTFGINLPTGHTGLSEDEAAAIRVVGAPALRMRTPVLGSGAGITAGTVYTGVIGPWAVGLGVAYEFRSTYTPLQGTVADAIGTVVDLTPAGVVHVSAAFDRLVGNGRMSILAVGDSYGTDDVTVRSQSGTPEIETQYRLGPTFRLSWDYELATGRLRTFRLSAAARYRSKFEDGSGAEVPGSGGTSLDVGAEAVLGQPGSIGLYLGLSGAFDSGADFDNSLATASMAEGTFTLGFEFTTARHSIRPFLAGSLGTFDTGPGSTGGLGMAAGCTLRTIW
jgi:hypothetical protein